VPATGTSCSRHYRRRRWLPRAWWELGTAPLGWPAYLSDVRNFAYGVGPTIGIRPDTGEAEALGAFGPNLADARLDDGAVVDRDGDGMADAIDGALRISGPGFDVADIAWPVAAPAAR
jgi:hypothetical protein